MQFKSTDCKFFRHRLTQDGIKVDPKKIEAIIHMDPPQNVACLQSFNGMVNYLKKFSPVLSELSESLRRLCKSGVKWPWEYEQQNAFEAIKQVITTLPVLAYFDKTKKHNPMRCLQERAWCSLTTGVQACHVCVKSIN